MNEKSLIIRICERKDMILLAVIAILFILLFRQCGQSSDLKTQLQIQSMNIDALHDSVRIEKNKAGEETYAKKLLLADKESLEKLNKDLGFELDKAKGKIIALEKIKGKVTSEIQYVDNKITVYPNGDYSLDWKFDTIYSEGNYKKFSGNSFFKIDTITNKVNPGKTRINENEFGFSFVTGIREKDKALEIFVTPKYPGMKITDIEGAIIDPSESDVLKKMFPNKKWAIGPFVGVGIGSGYGINGSPIAGAVISVGVCLQRAWIKF